MSRIRRLSQVISEEGRRALSSQQAIRIRDAAFSIVDEANLNTASPRKVTKKAAFTVVLRSLQSTRDLPFSLREHMALKELSLYIALAQSDKSNSLTLSNTDLLPVSHPRSTREHSMTASALTEARARWISNDPRIIDGYAKTIVASALISEFDSVEHIYYCSVLSSLPQGVIPADVLIAASNPFSGGNSSAERSLRSRLQRRDRNGQFAYMGGGLRALIRRENGKVYSLLGRPVIDNPDGDNVEMELPNGKLVNIPISKGEFTKAILNINRDPDGFSNTTAKVATTDDIINESDLVYVDQPTGWAARDNNLFEREDGQFVAKRIDKENGFRQFEVEKIDKQSGKRTKLAGVKDDWEDVLDSIDADENKKASLPSGDRESDEIIMDPPKDGKSGDDGDGEGPKPPKSFEFNYPEGAIKIKIDESYDPEGRIDEEAADYTDDPVEIAQMFEVDEILQGLEQGVLPEEEGDNAIGYAAMSFRGGDEFVPVQALYNALAEAGEDAPLELARIYDRALGGNDNENALKDSRKGVARLDQAKPDIAESFERTNEKSDEEEDATSVPKFEEDDALPPLLEGLSESEIEELRRTGDHTPFLPENQNIEIPEGYNTLNPEPFKSWRNVTAESPDENFPEGYSDNPVFLSMNVPQDKLEAELRRSIEPDGAIPGYANISFVDEDGEEFVANVPGEAIRDALQLQDVDTNKIIRDITAEGMIKQDEQGQEIGEDGPPPKSPIELDREYMEYLKKVPYNEFDKAFRDYIQQGPHDPLDPQYGGEFEREFEEYLNDDNSPNGVFNDLLRGNPDFARLLAWHQFDQHKSPIHSHFQESDEDAAERFDGMNAQDAFMAGEYERFGLAPTPALVIGAALSILMGPDSFYSRKQSKISALEDALEALKNEDMISDLEKGKDLQELNAVESVIESIQDEIERLQLLDFEENPGIAKDIDNEALFERRVAGESLDDLAKDLGIPRQEVRRREMEVLRARKAKENIAPELKPEGNIDSTPSSEVSENAALLAAFNIERALQMLQQEEDLAESIELEGLGISRSDAQALAAARMKEMYGVNADDVLLGLPAADVKKVLEENEKRIKAAEKAVLDNNALVMERSGSLQPIRAKDVQVGDFIWNAFFGRYEEVLSNVYAGTMNRMKMEVFNVRNNKKEIRFFEMDSPLRNVRRPGIQDEAEPIPPAKAAPRGGPRNKIKRAPISEQIFAKTGRPVARQKQIQGLFQDKNGVALKPGDVVIHPVHGRGVIKDRIGAQVEEGKKAGGQVRAGKVQPNKVIVQFEGDRGIRWVLKNSGRELKAANLELFDGDYGDLDIDPNFRGGAIVPNTPNNSADTSDDVISTENRKRPAPAATSKPNRAPAAPADEAPAEPVIPAMPRPMYKLNVEDKKGNRFDISVIKIDGMYEAAVFTEDEKVNAIIAKARSFSEVQDVVSRFVEEISESDDGNKVFRLYGDIPEPEKQPLRSVADAIPEIPEVEELSFDDIKDKAAKLAKRLEDKEFLNADLTPNLSEAEKIASKKYLLEFLTTDLDKNRQLDGLGIAKNYAMQLGWFEEAREIAALQQYKEKLALRPMTDEFNANITNIEALAVEANGLELDIHGKLKSKNARDQVSVWISGLRAQVMRPDIYSPEFRFGLYKSKAAVNLMLEDLRINRSSDPIVEILEKHLEILNNFGEIPAIPRTAEENDEVQKRLASAAKDLAGIPIDDLINGHKDWKFYGNISDGVNKVFILKNSVTKEKVVIKYDDDYYDRSGGIAQYYGNGVKAEEMVAQLYRDLGFAQPGFLAVNLDNPDRKLGGIGVMEFAGDSFFGLDSIRTHNNSPIWGIDQVAQEHKAELLNFAVANAIIGNSDRHGGNFMWGRDTLGQARLVPIDNGLALFNGSFGVAEKHKQNPLHLDPIKILTNEDMYGNKNQVAKFAGQWANEIGDEAAINQVVEFAIKMRERAEALKFADERANEYLIARANYIIDNASELVDTLRNFW